MKPRGPRRVAQAALVTLAVVATCVPPSLVRAEPNECEDAMDDEEVTARLDWIDARLRRGQPGAAVYWSGWLGYAALEGAIGWAEFARSHGRLDRDTWLVTGVGAVLWIGEMGIFPMRAAYAPVRMRRLPRGTPEERRIALVAAERILDRAADVEREGLSWESHALGLAWAFGSSAYIFARSWHRNGNEASHKQVLSVTGVELGLTVLLTEFSILTTPRQAIRDQRVYRASRCGPPPRLDARRRPSVQVGASPMSASMTVRW